MSHKSGHIIIERVGAAVKHNVAGDSKYVSIVLTVVGLITGGWFF
jgi:hypothetical protein